MHGETSGKNIFKIGVDFGVDSGVDFAWIFWDTEKRAEKIHTKSTPASESKSAPFFLWESTPESVLQNQKSTQSSHRPVPFVLVCSRSVF